MSQTEFGDPSRPKAISQRYNAAADSSVPVFPKGSAGSSFSSYRLNTKSSNPMETASVSGVSESASASLVSKSSILVDGFTPGPSPLVEGFLSRGDTSVFGGVSASPRRSGLPTVSLSHALFPQLADSNQYQRNKYDKDYIQGDRRSSKTANQDFGDKGSGKQAGENVYDLSSTGHSSTASTRSPTKHVQNGEGDKLIQIDPRLATSSNQTQQTQEKIKGRLIEGRLSKDYWKRDEHCCTCHICQSSFNIFRRRHHCRLCGQIFCSGCTCFVDLRLKKKDSELFELQEHRVCNYCFEFCKEFYAGTVRISEQSNSGIQESKSNLQPYITEKENGERLPSFQKGNDPKQDLSKTLNRNSTQSEGKSNGNRKNIDADFDDEVDGLKGYNESERRRMEAEDNEPDDDHDCEIDLSSSESETEDTVQPMPKNDSHEDESGKHRKSSFKRLSGIKFDMTWLEQTLGHERVSESFSTGVIIEEDSREATDLLREKLSSHTDNLIRKEAAARNLSTEWADIILNLARRAVNTINFLQDNSSSDIRNFIKIKKVPGGSLSECRFIEGFVCTKNVTHRSMESKIAYPRIIMLHCPIEFHRDEHTLTSLHPLMQQEREFLKTQVFKIASKKPDLLLVEKSVSRQAQEFLLKEKISLILNIKPRVLARIQWHLGYTIYDSIDDIEDIRPTMCQEFRLESFRVGEGQRKTLMFLDGCDSQLGCSIILRGAEQDTLKAVKEMILFATYALRHSKFETSLLIDCQATISPKTDTKSKAKRSSNETIEELTESHNSNSSFKHEQELSISYGVEFPSAPTSVSMWDVAPENIHQNFVPDEEALELDGQLVDLDKFTNQYLSYYVEEKELDIHDDINWHQKIVFLISKYCNDPPSVCEEPSLASTEYYTSSDICLGNYLMQACFSEENLCQKPGCRRDMFSHTRSFIHHNVRVNMGVNEISGQFRDDKYYIYIVCSICGTSTPWSELSEDSLNISFGKFLELIIYNKYYVNRNGGCKHPLFRSSILYFKYNDKIAIFQSEDITLSDIQTPSGFLEIERSLIAWNTEEEQLLKNLDDISAELASKIAMLETKFHLPEEKQIIQDFRRKVEKELQSNRQAVNGHKSSCNLFGLNNVKRDVIEMAEKWMSRVSDLYSKLKKEASTETRNPTVSHVDISSAASNTTNSSAGQLTIKESQAADSAPTVVSEKARLAEKISSPPIQMKLPRINSILDEPILSDMKNAVLSSSPHKTTEENQSTLQKGNQTSVSDTLGFKAVLFPPGKPHALTYIKETSGIYSIPTGINGTFIPVFFDEPGSFIAHTMCSQEYHNQMKSFGVVDSFLSPDESKSDIDFMRCDSNSPKRIELMNQLTDKSGAHIKHKFEGLNAGNRVNFLCIAYFAKQFKALRKLYLGGDTEYTHSVSRCKKWNATGGKSGSTFCKSLDDRFIIKEISRTEMDHFLSLGLDYFQYMSRVFFQNIPSSLVRIVGIYKVGYNLNVAGSSYQIQDLIVMENLFYDRKISRIFDLKGSTRSRYVRTTNKNTVLMDQNFLEFIYMSPLYTTERSKNYMKIAIINDTKFLSSVDVMDYSIIVGIDEEKQELVIGIIDYIRQYTWDKQFETWVKSAPVLGRKIKVQPTVISPAQYKDRFVVAMNKYFMMVPDKWCE